MSTLSSVLDAVAPEVSERFDPSDPSSVRDLYRRLYRRRIPVPVGTEKMFADALAETGDWNRVAEVMAPRLRFSVGGDPDWTLAGVMEAPMLSLFEHGVEIIEPFSLKTVSVPNVIRRAGIGYWRGEHRMTDQQSTETFWGSWIGNDNHANHSLYDATAGPQVEIGPGIYPDLATAVEAHDRVVLPYILRGFYIWREP